MPAELAGRPPCLLHNQVLRGALVLVVWFIGA